MSAAIEGTWTAEQFLAWAEGREARYEFDGFRPVAMTGGSARHNRITTNIHAALRSRLRGTPCAFYGPDLGVRIGEAIRYPDALVTCARFLDSARVAPDVRVIFEVLSPSSAGVDRIIKVKEYARVASMRRYVMVETRFPGVTVLHRDDARDAWRALVLTEAEILAVPEAAIEIPVAELYEDVAFAAAGDAE
jgi:Uma2 family endonuclease